MKSEKAITLVILVITIILLLILTSISVTYTIKEGGLFAAARRSKFNSEVAQIQETMELIKARPQYLKKGIDKETLTAKLQEEVSSKIWNKYSDFLVIGDDVGLYYNEENVNAQQKEWLEELGITAGDSSFKKFVIAESKGKNLKQVDEVTTLLNNIKQKYTNLNCIAKCFEEFADIETAKSYLPYLDAYNINMEIILENNGEILELDIKNNEVKDYQEKKHYKIMTLEEAEKEFVIDLEEGTIISYFGKSANPVVPAVVLYDGKATVIEKIGENAFKRTENPEEVLAYEAFSGMFADDYGNIDLTLTAADKNSILISFLEEEGINYTLKNGMAYILKFDTINSYSYDYLEEKEDCLKVGRYYIEKSEGYGKNNYRNNITSVELPYTLREIGEMAFFGQTIERLELDNVSHTGSQLKIEKDAFEYCTNLKSINLNYAIIDQDAFDFNDDLEEIIVYEAKFYSSFINSSKIKKIISEGDDLIFYQGCFGNTPNFELLKSKAQIDFHGGVRFGENCGLKKVEAVGIYGEYSPFANCANLEEIIVKTYYSDYGKWGAPESTKLTVTGIN